MHAAVREHTQVGPAPRLYHTNQGLLERSGAVQDTVRLGLAQAFGKPESEQDGALQLALVRAALQFSYHAGNAALMVKGVKIARAGRWLCRCLPPSRFPSRVGVMVVLVAHPALPLVARLSE